MGHRNKANGELVKAGDDSASQAPSGNGVGNLPTPLVCPIIHVDVLKRYCTAGDVDALRAGKFSAEIIPGCDPKWHVILHKPGEASIAMAHLVERGFGCYQPMIEQKIKPIGKRPAQVRRAPLFRGYLFLFVWDAEEHWRRILACPGVLGVVSKDGKPVMLSDAQIDEMQGLELTHSPLATSRLFKKRPRFRDNDPDAFKVTVSTRSFFKDASALDDEGRISLLAKALGLAS